MKKLLIYILSLFMVLMFISCESKDDVNVGFSEKYLVGNMSGGSSFEDYDVWRNMVLKYRICYDGCVEIYMPSSTDKNATYELAGSYQLTKDEIEYLKKSINQKKLYKLDPKTDYGTCDGESKILYLYDKNDEVLKTCGGYVPTNSDFLDMYKAVINTIHVDEHIRIREEWTNKLKSEAGVK